MKKNTQIERIGETSTNKYGSLMTIIKYNNALDITVQFEQGNLVNTQYNNFKKGEVKNVYDKSIFGVGYLGEGNYQVWEDNKHIIQYEIWVQMLRRCHDNNLHERYPTYKGCTICNEWHNFQNFAKWYDENIYECEEKLNLDKDILVKGNKVYSPKTCIFVPQKINKLFTKNNANRGKYPIGVTWNNQNKKFQYRNYNDLGRSGYFNSVEEAFSAYKLGKENYIKQVAEEYKDKIPVVLYDAMIKYQVDITD